MTRESFSNGARHGSGLGWTELSGWGSHTFSHSVGKENDVLVAAGFDQLHS